MSATPEVINEGAPMFGEHTTEILNELGYDSEEPFYATKVLSSEPDLNSNGRKRSTSCSTLFCMESTPDNQKPDTLNDIGVLKRREIEARIVAPLIERFAEEFEPTESPTSLERP